MFKRILIPTDGSQVARKAISAGIALAKHTWRERGRVQRSRASRGLLL